MMRGWCRHLTTNCFFSETDAILHFSSPAAEGQNMGYDVFAGAFFVHVLVSTIFDELLDGFY